MQSKLRAFARRWFAETVGWRSAIIIPVALVLVWCRSHGLVAESASPWLIVAALVAATLVNTAIAAATPPVDTAWSVWLRAVGEIGMIAVVIYVIGWGPTLAVGLAAGAANAFARSGSRAERAVVVSTLVSLAFGELAIAMHWAPTLVPPPLVHAVALLAAIGLVVVIRFMSDGARARERATDELAASERRFRALVQYTTDALIVFDPIEGVDYASPALERIFGRSAQELMSADVVHPDDVDRLRELFAGGETLGDEPQWVEVRVRHRDGSWHHLEITVTDRRDDPAIARYVANLRDITERRLFEQQLSYQAFHDALTRLPNRAQFVERLERAIERAEAHEGALAVLFLDVDRFKLVNDSLGHEVGDRLLTEIAGRLRAALRPGDLVARFGGDEFTVLLEDVRSSSDAIAVAERILRSLEAPVLVGGRDLHVSSSIGISVGGVTESEINGSDLLREADLAMYLAKERGRSRWELYDSHTAPEIVERLEIDNGLRRALANREVAVHFQPEVALDGSGVVAFEALARWPHPTRGFLSPNIFVPIAEESSLVLDLDRYVLRESLRQARLWNTYLTNHPVRVSVNLSARFLAQSDVVHEVRDLLETEGAQPEWLQVEITERIAIEHGERTDSVLASLRALGIAVAIDDFGTGYSSLSYLRQLPADVLKLDQSFLTDAVRQRAQSAIVQAIITMGHALGVRVTAEGVERADQLDELRDLGCDTAQGFLWSEPVPAEGVRGLLETLGALRQSAPVDLPAEEVRSAD